jgi:hypothetical protein
VTVKVKEMTESGCFIHAEMLIQSAKALIYYFISTCRVLTSLLPVKQRLLSLEVQN